jgi:hypothetical protein
MPKVRRMTTSFRLRFCASVIACCAVLIALPGAGEARARHHGHVAHEPVVVELYTAQGCATCPKANGVIGDLASKKGVLPLTFSVDYWDYLGWSDTLAKPEFTARQRAYAGRLKVREIYTPEIVVDGAAEGAALEQKKIGNLIDQAETHPLHGPHLRFSRHGTRVSVSGRDSGGRSDVWLIRYAPDPQTVKIKAGENKGQTVTVRNAVRELKRLGIWRGAAKTYSIEPADDKSLKTVVLVQAPHGGRILAAARG